MTVPTSTSLVSVFVALTLPVFGGCIGVKQQEADVLLPGDAASDDAAADVPTVPDIIAPPNDVDPRDSLDDVESDIVAVDVTDGDLFDVDSVEDIAVIALPCLPVGCTAPAAATCELSSGWCWLDGACVPDGERDPNESCRSCDAAAKPLAWQIAEGGSDCDDGLDCTTNDICLLGVCSGTSTCNEPDLNCVSARCDRDANACVETINSGTCRLDGTCFSAGNASNDGCHRCDPTTSQRAWTPGDRHEPDDTFATAHGLPFDDALSVATDFRFGWNGPWTESRIVPRDDIDRFTFSFLSPNGFQRPIARIVVDPGVVMRLCMEMRCRPEVDGEVVVTNRACQTGPAHTSTGQDADGWIGCCSEMAAEQILAAPQQAACLVSGAPATRTMDVRLSVSRKLPSTDTVCLPYELQWGKR